MNRSNNLIAFGERALVCAKMASQGPQTGLRGLSFPLPPHTPIGLASKGISQFPQPVKACGPPASLLRTPVLASQGFPHPTVITALQALPRKKMA